jgi:hypothetical protein
MNVGGMGSGMGMMNKMGGAGGRPSPEDLVAKFDTDGDGFLVASEVDGSRLADKFADVDGDGNGELNKDELQTHFDSMMEQMKQKMGSGMGGGMGMMMQNMGAASYANLQQLTNSSEEEKDPLMSLLDSLGQSDDEEEEDNSIYSLLNSGLTA